MKKEIKGIIIGSLATSMIWGVSFAAECLQNVVISNFPISVNGESYTATNPVLNYNGSTYLALREFGTVVGTKIDFKDGTILIGKTPTVVTPDGNTTIGEKNALEKAKSYLEYSAFSYTGLIKQLEYSKFTTEEATYAANNCGANWNEQAAKKAQAYLDYSSFSRNGLIEQLEYEGFTNEQAVYGTEAVGY